MKYIRLLCWLLLLLTWLSTNPIQANDHSPKTIQELKQALESIVHRYQVPALGIAILDKNGPLWIETVGLSNRENNTPATNDSLFRVGSTSKMLVALAILKLQEKGLVKLNDNLKDLAPEIEFKNQWESTHPIKVVHLLEHTTGWDEQHYPEFAHNQSPPITLQEGLDFHPHSRRSRWVPGSRYAYNNTGPNVAAFIVEKVSGQKFEDFVKNEILTPLAMTRTTYFNDEIFHSLGTTGYDKDNQPLNYHHFIGRPSAALNSSINDMANLLSLFIHRGKLNGYKVISEQSIQRMENPRSSLAAQQGMKTGYGLANYSAAHGRFVYREHNGGIEGFMSQLSYLPNDKLGHVILTNTKNVAAFQKISNLIKEFETQQLIASKNSAQNNDELHSDSEAELFVLSQKDKQALQGLYYPINPRVQLFNFIYYITNMKTFHFENDRLVQGKAIGSSKNDYRPISDKLFASQETGLISIAKVDDPLVGEVIHYAYKDSARQTFVLKKINSWFGYGQLFVGISWLLIIIVSFFKTIILGIKMLRRTRIPKEVARLQKWPLLTSWCFIATWALLNIAFERPYELMSEPTFVSVGIMLSTILFATFSAVAVWSVYNYRKLSVNRFSYWYYTFSSAVHFLMTLTLMKFGVVGIIFWA